ncbi:MAG: hypothetical protein ACTS73_08480 [Arsenophonus sp. NEOnobi-MAG3]
MGFKRYALCLFLRRWYIHSYLSQDDPFCLLLIIGVTEYGSKELVMLKDAYRWLETNLPELLNPLRARRH